MNTDRYRAESRCLPNDLACLWWRTDTAAALAGT
jgi:hypothetical protein